MLPSLVVTKLAVNIVSSLGVAKVVGDIIKNNTVVLTTAQKVLVNTGGVVLGSMIVDHACDYVNKQFDELVGVYKDRKEIPPPTDQE